MHKQYPGQSHSVKEPEPFTLELMDGGTISAHLYVQCGALKIDTQGLGVYTVKAESARDFANLILWLLFDATNDKQRRP